MTRKTGKHIVIIGPGKLGRVLAAALKHLNYSVELSGRAGKPDIARADIVFITTQDQNIARAAKDLAKAKWRKGAIVLHCSGSQGSDILSPLRDRGVLTASCHPLQSFPDVKSGLRALPGTYWFCEGQARALVTLKPVLKKLRGKVLTIDAKQKTAYHAAVCVAANYLTSLVGVASDIAKQIGLREADFRAALAPILHVTLDNTIAKGPRAALTGPIQRNDRATIQKHQKSIKQLGINSKELLGVYDVLYKYTKKHLI